jgi:hypothetical protein
MAIIYSYPKNTNILGTDVLIGTSTIVQNGKRKNQTKSFTMLDISNYVSGNLTLDIPTLQQVSDAGKTVSYPDGVDGMAINIDDQSSNNYYGLNVAATSDANGINASSNNGFGVNAFSTNGTGVNAASTNGSGVYAYSTNATGVVGSSDTGSGVYAYSIDGFGVYATSANGFGVYATSISGKAGVFNIQAVNTSNIVEFKKNSVNQAYITHNGTIVSNKSLINTTVDNGVDTLQVEGSGFFQNAVTIKEGLLKLNNDFSGNYTVLYAGLAGFGITRDNGNGFGIDDINGFVTNTSATATSFIKEGGTSSQFLKADGTVDSTTYVKVLLNDFPDTAVTGTITETLLSTFTINPNTFPTTCMPTFLIRMSKTGDVGASTVRLRFSTTNNPATATTLATYIIPPTIDSAIIGRNPIIKGGNIRIGVPTSTFLSEASQATSTESVIPFNVTVPIYLFVLAANDNITDTTTLRAFKITN